MQHNHKVKNVLDICCGSRMFHFDKNNPSVLFGDIRKEDHILCDGRSLTVSPDIVFDFTDLPFINNHFNAVIFDPPHLENVGKNSWMYKKYGKLNKGWREDLTEGFNECFRVLADKGVLIFKWNEIQIKTSEILSLAGRKPLIGHISGKRADTHWISFIK